MENVVLIGNGFDIHHKFPTWYRNFLHVAKLLIGSDLSKLKTVGDVLSDERLHEVDPHMKKCFDTHREAYFHTILDVTKAKKLVGILEDNMWFNYFVDSFDKDSNWIDFEKEVALVLSCFEDAFLPTGEVISFEMENEYLDSNYKLWIVTRYFDFFIDHERTKRAGWDDFYQFVKREYIVEYPYGSGCISVDKKRIIEKLYFELVGLTEGLKLYFELFVENVLESFNKLQLDGRIGIFRSSGTTITFNYTGTFEWAYFNRKVIHIHGSVNGDIVLGINPDKHDSLDKMDTSFLVFKKYFQRTYYGTDLEYIRWISDVKKMNVKYRLITMGHSLDVTDKDIIVDLFVSAAEIIILYHEDAAKKEYIKKLVEIFGREEFEHMKFHKGLRFALIADAEQDKLGILW